MTHLPLIHESEATGEIKQVFDHWLAANPDRDSVPPIIKAFAHHPAAIKSMLSMCYPLHFSDGHLSRRVKEMLATYSSALNGCPY